MITKKNCLIPFIIVSCILCFYIYFNNFGNINFIDKYNKNYIKFNIINCWPFSDVDDYTKAKLLNAVNLPFSSNEINLICMSIENEIDKSGIDVYCNSRQNSKIKLTLEVKNIDSSNEEKVKYYVNNFFVKSFDKYFYHNNKHLIYYFKFITKFKYGYIIHLKWKFVSDTTTKECLVDIDGHTINMFISEIYSTIFWVSID